ncbi:hypothetical protein K9L97_04710 [Candidatus Woesearchaeota archaeon]|nr:hypothetical protein [Candidatus Woesearchaeota archaeon]
MVRKGQTGSNAAIVIIIIVVLMLLYILFLPPGDRQQLLEGGIPTGQGSTTNQGDGTSTGTLQEYLLREQVGKVYKQGRDEKDLELATTTIGTKTESQIVKQKSTIYVKNSIFEDIQDNLQFDVDPNLANNLILSFNVDAGIGTIIIKLNDETIFRGDLAYMNSPPITLDKQILRENNIITFEVESPGIAFWKYNHYTLSNIKITGDIKDTRKSKNTQTFSLEESDYERIDTTRLRYLPECQEEYIRDLEIQINDEKIFEGIPDCKAYNYISINKETLQPGTNKIEFDVTEGTIMIDRPQLQIKFKKADYNTYYFEIPDKYFEEKSEEPRCGEIDNICPTGCYEDEDKDCCLRRSSNYWCDVDTENNNDRCVSFVADCERCQSGYEDRSGNAPNKCIDEFEREGGYCGDDKDGECPRGCSPYYDKDCCYENEGYYWCSDVPIQGLESVCEQDISEYECDDCPSEYRNENGHRPSCPEINTIEDLERELKSNYDIKLELSFPNTREKKETDISINGYKIGINTYTMNYDHIIDEFVKPGTNSVEIQPETDFTITELVVKLLN